MSYLRGTNALQQKGRGREEGPLSELSLLWKRKRRREGGRLEEEERERRKGRREGKFRTSGRSTGEFI